MLFGSCVGCGSRYAPCTTTSSDAPAPGDPVSRLRIRVRHSSNTNVRDRSVTSITVHDPVEKGYFGLGSENNLRPGKNINRNTHESPLVSDHPFMLVRTPVCRRDAGLSPADNRRVAHRNPSSFDAGKRYHSCARSRVGAVGAAPFVSKGADFDFFRSLLRLSFLVSSPQDRWRLNRSRPVRKRTNCSRANLSDARPVFVSRGWRACSPVSLSVSWRSIR